MEIGSFAKTNGIKVSRVEKWIKDGLIPGADLDENHVPDSARMPYTQARAKNAKAIYRSIVQATKQRRHVLSQIYGICPEEFESYINQLIEAGLIVRRKTDGITYYDATPKAINADDKNLKQIIESVASAITPRIIV